MFTKYFQPIYSNICHCTVCHNTIVYSVTVQVYSLLLIISWLNLISQLVRNQMSSSFFCSVA